MGAGVILWSGYNIKREPRGEPKDEFNTVNKRLDSIEADIQDLGAEAQDTQGLLLFKVANFVTKSLAGNNKPMLEWAAKVERCRATGGQDCLNQKD